MRSVAGWLVLLPALLLRKANRRESGKLLVALLSLYVALGVVEWRLNTYLIFHYHQYICSVFADLFRFLAVSITILLAVGDRINIPVRPLRFALVLLVLFLACNVQIVLNAWPFLDSGKWSLIFGIMLLVFLIGNSIVIAMLRRVTSPGRFRAWYLGFCGSFGIIPLLILGAVELLMSRSVQLQSSQEVFRIVVVLAAAICVPYAVLCPFLLLASRSPLYGARLDGVLGIRNPRAETPIAREPEPISTAS